MGSFSDYLEDELLDHLFGKGSYTPPTIYIALSTADPTDDGSGIAEPSGGSYARKVTAGSDWNVSSSGTIDNASEIQFAEATGSWGTLTHFALFDAVSGGNMLAHGSLTASVSISSGETATWAAGAMTVALD